jgi:4-hydroxy-3-methylbut-2-enyl diphosphate reductase
MQVETDKMSGFCFGVQNAVEIAEKALLRGEKVYSLGSIVHNEKEIERLSSLGLLQIDHKQFRKLRNCNVLIRAHGEPPETYLIAEKNNISIIEATCPIVKRLQSRIRKTWLMSKENGGQVLIYGKPGHAEVVGLLGQTNNEAILISGPDDIKKVDLKKPVYFFSQTTMDIKKYYHIAEMIRSGMRETGISDTNSYLKVYRTICKQVANRELHLMEFAVKHEIIIFVSGRESSNGKMLFSVCKNVNPDSYFVSKVEDIDREWFTGKKSAGVCGATSTPKWLIEEIHDHVLKL